MKRTTFAAIALASTICVSAQDLCLKGIGHNNRYDDGDQMKSEYLGWNSETGKAIFIVDNGLYAMTWNGTSLSTPEKNPPVEADDIRGDNTKELWANNFNLMYGNSGAVYVNGKLLTVTSRDESSTTDDKLFYVRKWDATTGDLLSTTTKPKSSCLESAGMSYNPLDGKVYGLFYLTEAQLPTTITDDPDYFVDQDDTDFGREGLDAGYAICTIDLATLKITPITPGLYYSNFVTFAINSEGRAFALTSGGSNGYIDEQGKVRNIDNQLAGAQLCEFDLETGLMLTKPVERTDPETGEPYISYENIYDQGTGYCSQYSRQSACFSNSNPYKMYWVGYYNSGKGVNDYGSWTTLSDREWRTNGKYDTALYEVDITTGIGTRLSKIDNRWTFSALWVDGDDPSDGAPIDPFNPGNEAPEGVFIAIQQAESGSVWQKAEMGVQYSYFIEANDGWRIHSVTFNDNELDIDENGFVTTPAISAALNRLIVTYEQVGHVNVKSIDRDSDIRVLAKADGLHITGTNNGDQLVVYTADGRLCHSATINAASADVTLAPGQLYIAKVGNKVVKVRL